MNIMNIYLSSMKLLFSIPFFFQENKMLIDLKKNEPKYS